MSRPSVLLADDHKLFAEGVRRILESRYEFIGTATDGRELVEKAEAGCPDVILIDISMPELNGIDAVRRLRKGGCTAKLIILTMHADPGFASEAFEAGAQGYVLKHCAEDELLEAVREVLQGKTYLSSQLSRDLLQTFRGRAPQPEGLTAKLTDREREVLQLLAEGKSAKEIAADLRISRRTVEFHRYNLSDKLGLKSVPELARYAVRHGLVTP